MVRVFASKSISAYALLALALDECHGFKSLPPISREAHGKPFFSTLPHIQFSVSHSGGYALCALGDTTVGADIEVVRPRRPTLPGYALTAAELGRWDGTWPGFYALWTGREAWSKYTGLGVARSRHQDVPHGLTVTSYGGPDWRASVCAQGAAGDISWR